MHVTCVVCNSTSCAVPRAFCWPSEPSTLALEPEEMYVDAMWWEEVEVEKPEKDLATGARL